MNVYLYKSCYGITRNSKVIGPIYQNTEIWRRTHPWRYGSNTWTDTGKWNIGGEPDGPNDIISVHASREEAEAELRRMQGGVDASNEEPSDLIEQLYGRARFLRWRGEVKSPDLMERAADALLAALEVSHDE